MPWFSVSSDSPVSSLMGSSTLYMAAAGMPTTSVYTHMLAVLSAFRRGDQFKGSSGSAVGAGTRTMSFWAPLACCACMVPSRSTRWTVPGMGTPCSSVVSRFGAIVSEVRGSGLGRVNCEERKKRASQFPRILPASI